MAVVAVGTSRRVRSGREIQLWGARARVVSLARVLVGVMVVLVGAAGCGGGSGVAGGSSQGALSSQPAGSSGGGYPDAIVALGHSGVTGYDSDPSSPDSDATANSWITGTNPAVDSLYLRILAKDPAIKGHNTNLGQDGSTVDALPGQAREAVSLKPTPQLVVIETVDNDIRCDGTDPQNYRPFGVTLTRALRIITTGAPAARIFIVSSPWATVRRFATVIKDTPAAVSQFEGTGPCDLYSPAGRPTPKRWAHLQHIIDGYYAVLAATCARFSRCHYDGGVLAHFPAVMGDITPDYNHLSIQGQHKVAALEWANLY
jgi:hypothetical protein